MANLSFDELRLFARVAALASLSAVARERNVAVSQVSRSLQRIEAAYGAQLVLRSTHGLSLTPEGEILQRYGRRILEELDDLDAALDQPKGEAAGLVRISMSAVIAQHLLVDSLPSLHQKHPLLRVDFRADDALVDMARDGIDIAIRTGEPVSEHLVMRRLGNLERRLYASPVYLKQRGTPASPADLKHHALLGNSLHPHLNEWRLRSHQEPGHCEPLDIQASSPFLSDNTAVIASFALAGLGIGRLVSVVAEPLVRQGKLAPVLEAWTCEEPVALSAFMLAGRHRLPKIRACLDHWAEWLKR